MASIQIFFQLELAGYSKRWAILALEEFAWTMEQLTWAMEQLA